MTGLSRGWVCGQLASGLPGADQPGPPLMRRWGRTQPGGGSLERILFVLHLPVTEGSHWGLCSALPRVSSTPALVIMIPPVTPRTAPRHALLPAPGDPELVFSMFVFPAALWGELVCSGSSGPISARAGSRASRPAWSVHAWMLSALYLLKMESSQSFWPTEGTFPYFLRFYCVSKTSSIIFTGLRDGGRGMN